MSNNEITLSTIYNLLQVQFAKIENKFEEIDRKFEQIDKRFEEIDKRLDNIDIRITKLAADNKEEHEKIFEAIQFNNNAIFKMEQTFNEKIAILFDAEKANRERSSMLSLQTTKIFEEQEKLKLRVSILEKKII